MSIFRLTKRADYALSILAYLANKKDKNLVTLTELAGLGYPRAFTAQITKELVKKGVITSAEGRKGGYELVRPAGSVQIREALEAIEGNISPVSCLDGGECLIKDCCQQRKFMSRFQKEMQNLLADYTIADLVS